MNPKKKIPSLDGLRILAALAVVAYHYAPYVAGFSTLPMFAQNLVLCGPLAVPFFFILSGFVLSHAYSTRMPLTPLSRRQFWWARVARLYPIYLLAWLLFLPMAYAKYLGHAGGHGRQVGTFLWSGILSALALHAWTPLSQAWNGPSWSLSVEMFFYFVFPFFALPLLTTRRERALTLTAAAWAAMLVLDLCHVTGEIPKGTWLAWFSSNPLLSLPTFVMGIVTYRIYRRSESLGRSGLPFLLAALSIVALAAWSTQASREFLIGGAAAPLMAFLILTAAHASPGIEKTVGNPILAKLGTTSFTIYIMQAPVWHIARLLADKLHLEAAGQNVAPMVFVVYLIALILLALVLQAKVEGPARSWLMGWKSRRRGTLVTESAST